MSRDQTTRTTPPPLPRHDACSQSLPFLAEQSQRNGNQEGAGNPRRSVQGGGNVDRRFDEERDGGRDEEVEEGDGSHGVRRDDEKDEFGASEGKGKDIRDVRRGEEKGEGKEETEERRKIEIKIKIKIENQ